MFYILIYHKIIKIINNNDNNQTVNLNQPLFYKTSQLLREPS